MPVARSRILESGLGELAVDPCSGACREAIELYFSTPPERWRARRSRDELGCGILDGMAVALMGGPRDGQRGVDRCRCRALQHRDKAWPPRHARLTVREKD